MKTILSFDEEVTLTRQMLQKNEYQALLIWGWLTAIVAIALYITKFFVDNNTLNLAWLVIPQIGCILQVRVQHRRLNEPTALYKMLARVSRMVVGVIFVIAVASTCFTIQPLFCILLVLSLWCGFTAFMLDYKELRAPCIGGFALSCALLTVSPHIALAVFAAGIVAVLIVPGYILRKDAKKDD